MSRCSAVSAVPAVATTLVKPDLVGGDGVGVSLDNDRSAGVPDWLSGEVEAVEQRPLLVQLGLGGVEILGAVTFDESPGEPSGPAVWVVDREDHSVAHPVVETAVS